MSGSGLAAQQGALADVLRRASSVAGDAEAAGIATAIAAGNERLSPAQQVDIYREQYFLRHIDALRHDFGALAHLLGAGRFGELARAYLAAHPPSSFTLRDLGHAVPRFVVEHRPWSDDALLADLARVEWAFVEAFDAPAAPPLDPGDLAAIPEHAWPGVSLVLHPAVRRVALTLPAHEYRLAVRTAGHAERPGKRASYVVVYRGPEALHDLEVDAGAYTLLDELARGTALGEACEAAAAIANAPLEVFQAALGGWFQQWTALGWISRVVSSPRPEA
jgi:hypothetical protein